MFRVPVTYFFDFVSVTDRMRPYIMAEFAAAGAKHLVLTDALLQQIIAQPGLEDELLKEMSDAGLSFLDAHAPFGPVLDLNCPFPEKRAMMIARAKLALEICGAMKVDTITIHVGNNHFEPASAIPAATHAAWVKEALAELLPVAEKNGIIICIENIWFQVNTPDVLNAIKAEFPTDALGFCYDSGHANIMDRGRDYATGNAWSGWRKAGIAVPEWEDKALEKMLPQTVICHLHDNTGWNDAHDLPGRGNVDWPKILKLLDAAPRLKLIQSEVAPQRKLISIPELVAKFDELSQLV